MMKTANSIAFQSPQFSLLSESQLKDIHLAALEVLRRTGIRFHHREAVDMLKKAGAFVSDGNLVRLPARMVEDAIASAPGRIVMCDRDGEPAMFLEGTKVYFGTGSDCLNFLDPETGEHRKFTQADIANGYRLCDALPNIHFNMSIGIPSDVDPEVAYDVQMALMLEHSTKPIVFVTNDRASCQRAIDMAAAVAGGYEALREQQHILLYSEPTSPFQQSETAVDKLLLMAEHELPVVHSPGPQMGATAPITMAGGLVMSLAEIFSSLVVHQLKRRGAPFVFGAGLHHMDMGSAQICYASPEFQLTKAAVAELGRWYGMPTWGYASCSDAKVMDEQAAVEATLAVLMAKLSGGNLIHDVGYMESGLTTSFEMIVLNDELVAMTNHLMKGIEVSDDTLMVEELDRVGPGGHFMDTKETLKRFRDFWFPGLLDRRTRLPWLEAGGTTLGQRLTARVLEIIKEHQPRPLDPDKKQKVQEILAQAAK
ncbi:MAG TPA: trimethylamine methyltransferase family protein [Anaerolineae bacterium]|nr:trimethylamine methyltransferase family protein [Anaerolineae bacterium]